MDCNTASQLAQKLSHNVTAAQQLHQTNDVLQQQQHFDPIVSGNIFSPTAFDPTFNIMNDAFSSPPQMMEQRRAAALQQAKQQHEMEQAFNTQNTVQQGPLGIQQEIGAAPYIPSMMTMASLPGMISSIPRTAFQPSLNLALQRELLSSSSLQATTAVEAQDTAWIDRLGEQNWNTNFDDVEQYVPPGEEVKTTEQKTKESQFYGFMDSISQKRVLIDEVNGTLLEGPGPDPELEEDTQKLKEWVAEEGIVVPPEVFESAQANFKQKMCSDAFTAYGVASPIIDERNMAEDEEYAKMDVMEDDQPEDWAKNFAETHEAYEKTMNCTDYPFEENNPYKYVDNPMQEGKEMLALSNLAEAALAFEAACQKDNENMEAWFLLGTTQAKNEKDRLSLIALNNARRVDPTNIEVHAALGAVHTNMYNVSAAMESMKAWLAYHPEYGILTKMKFEPTEAAIAEDELVWLDPGKVEEITTLYNAALEMHSDDPVLHANLGIVHNMLHEFDAAAKEFRAAAELNPQDPVVWNRLGASLANAGRPKEAQEAYRTALDLQPGYVRCFYNLAVALSNDGNHLEAAKVLIRALEVQRGLSEPTRQGMGESHSLWEILRMCLSQIGRHDLVELSYNENIQEFENAL